jgi:hypothetical protein
MVRRLMLSARKCWRLLNGSKLLPDVIARVRFIDGIKFQEAAARQRSSSTIDHIFQRFKSWPGANLSWHHLAKAFIQFGVTRYPQLAR